MAETGIMGSSGEFRTNQTSTSNPAGNAAKSGFGKAADIFAKSSAQRRQMSHQQFQAAAEILRTKVAGKQIRKTMRVSSELNQSDITHAKKSGVESFGGNRQTGEFNTKFRAPRTRAAAPSTGPATGPAKPAATRTAPTYNARNPHPKNPFEKGTKEHKGYNTATGPQRAAMTRRSKQGIK